MTHNTITQPEVLKWASGCIMSTPQEVLLSYLTEILNGEYDLKSAREDILSHREIKAPNNKAEVR